MNRNKTSEIFNSSTYTKLTMASMFIYTLTSLPFEQISKVASVIFLVLSLPLLFQERKKIFKDPMVVILGFIIIIQIASWLSSTIQYPEFANSIPKLDRLTKLFLFIFIAYWLKGNTRKIYALLFCYLTSVLLSLVIYPDAINVFIAGLDGVRVNFGLKNAQYTSMFGGMCFIICAFFILQEVKKLQKNIYYILLLILLSVIFFIVMLISQSRQVFLALLVSILVLPILAKITINTVSIKNTFLFYILILLSVLTISNMNFVDKRVMRESSAINLVLQGDIDKIPMDDTNSTLLRVNSWIESWKWIKKNPVLGADSSAIPQVIIQSEKFQSSSAKGFRHLHNFHIEVLVAYGILGLLAIYAVYGWLLISLFKIKKKIPEATPFALLASVFCVFWFIINFFENFDSRSYGVFTHNIILGCCYTFYLTNSLQSQKEE